METNNNKIETAYRYYQAGDLSNARESCKKILRIHPEDIDVVMLLADISYRLQDYGTAIAALKKAIGIMPASGELYCNLGLLFQVQEKPEEAIDCFREALRLESISCPGIL